MKYFICTYRHISSIKREMKFSILKIRNKFSVSIFFINSITDILIWIKLGNKNRMQIMNGSTLKWLMQVSPTLMGYPLSIYHFHNCNLWIHYEDHWHSDNWFNFLKLRSKCWNFLNKLDLCKEKIMVYWYNSPIIK